MKLIVKKVDEGIFDFCESSDGTTYDGQIYGGTSVKLSYLNNVLVVSVDSGERETYALQDLNYDDGNEIIGFASMNEFIIALKGAGFTGNFNTPQVGGVNKKEYYGFLQYDGNETGTITPVGNSENIFGNIVWSFNGEFTGFLNNAFIGNPCLEILGTDIIALAYNESVLINFTKIDDNSVTILGNFTGYGLNLYIKITTFN